MQSQKPAPPATKIASKATLIARGTKLTGKITGNAEVVVEGELEGEVHLDGHVEIAGEGRVQGNLQVRSARIAGVLVGNVVGREVVEVTNSGRLEGDVQAPRVIIREGGFFGGNIEMTGQRQPQAKPVAGASAPPAAAKG